MGVLVGVLVGLGDIDLLGVGVGVTVSPPVCEIVVGPQVTCKL